MDALPAKEAPPDVTSQKTFAKLNFCSALAKLCQTKPQSFCSAAQKCPELTNEMAGDFWSLARSISMIIIELMTRRTSVNATGSKLMAEFCFFLVQTFFIFECVGRGRIHSNIHTLQKVQMSALYAFLLEHCLVYLLFSFYSVVLCVLCVMCVTLCVMCVTLCECFSFHV